MPCSERQSAIHVEDGTVHVVVLDQLAHGEVDGLQARPGGAAESSLQMVDDRLAQGRARRGRVDEAGRDCAETEAERP